tara:strand:- start:18 stop:254 length:237 start_codon:yes stop_codon:yes gene_type:complete
LSKAYSFLDLKSITCPLNLVKCKLALEKISAKEILIVDLDKGEPEVMVKNSLEKMGYEVRILEDDKNWVRFEISNEFK